MVVAGELVPAASAPAAASEGRLPPLLTGLLPPGATTPTLAARHALSPAAARWAGVAEVGFVVYRTERGDWCGLGYDRGVAGGSAGIPGGLPCVATAGGSCRSICLELVGAYGNGGTALAGHKGWVVIELFGTVPRAADAVEISASPLSSIIVRTTGGPVPHHPERTAVVAVVGAGPGIPTSMTHAAGPVTIRALAGGKVLATRRLPSWPGLPRTLHRCTPLPC